MERAWADIHWRHEDVPHIIAVMATAGDKRHPRRGHLLSSTWEPGPHGVAELVVARRVTELDGRALLEALLHEAAHGLAWARDVADLSGRAGLYHTAGYRTAATELGLTCRRDRATGWSLTEMPRPLLARNRGTVRRLGAALASAGDVDHVGADRSPGEVSLPAAYALLMCPCGRRIRMSLGVLARGPVVCRICGDEFAPVL